MFKTIAALFLTLSLAGGAHAASGESGAPAITFTKTTVRVSGITPGGTVVIYGVTMESIDYGTTVMRYSQVLQDDDHDGIVTYDHRGQIPSDGVWVAVDAQNGQFALSTPKWGLRIADAQVHPLRKNATGIVDSFAFGYRNVEMLYIHPGHGVWAVSGFDKSVRPGMATVSLRDAVSLLPSGEARASEFAPGTTIIAFDLPFFRVTTLHLTGADLGGAQ